MIMLLSNQQGNGRINLIYIVQKKKSPSLDRNYIFPTDLAPNEIQFGTKSNGKALSAVVSAVECSSSSLKLHTTTNPRIYFGPNQCRIEYDLSSKLHLAAS